MAISYLKIHQQWRLGADIVMIEPKELTESIDILLKYIESSYTEEQLEQAIEMARLKSSKSFIFYNHSVDEIKQLLKQQSK